MKYVVSLLVVCVLASASAGHQGYAYGGGVAGPSYGGGNSFAGSSYGGGHSGGSSYGGGNSFTGSSYGGGHSTGGSYGHGAAAQQVKVIHHPAVHEKVYDAPKHTYSTQQKQVEQVVPVITHHVQPVIHHIKTIEVPLLKYVTTHQNEVEQKQVHEHSSAASHVQPIHKQVVEPAKHTYSTQQTQVQHIIPVVKHHVQPVINHVKTVEVPVVKYVASHSHSVQPQQVVDQVIRAKPQVIGHHAGGYAQQASHGGGFAQQASQVAPNFGAAASYHSGSHGGHGGFSGYDRYKH